MADFKNLLVWHRAHALSLRVFHTARMIRGADHLSLKSQMIRAAQSIPANIVEGRRQPSDRAFAKFLRISVNSASELEYHLITARDLGVLSPEEFVALCADLEEVQRMLYSFIRTLGESRSKSS